MTAIMVYLLIGDLVLLIYSFASVVHTSHVPVKEALKDFLHPVVFVLLWPLDLIWCLYSLIKHTDDFEEGVHEMFDKYGK